MLRIRLFRPVRHLAHCVLMAIVIYMFVESSGALTSGSEYPSLDPFAEYGVVITIVLYLFRLLPLLALPQSLANFLGLTLYNAFPPKVKLKVTHPAPLRSEWGGWMRQPMNYYFHRRISLYVHSIYRSRPTSLFTGDSSPRSPVLFPSQFYSFRNSILFLILLSSQFYFLLNSILFSILFFSQFFLIFFFSILFCTQFYTILNSILLPALCYSQCYYLHNSILLPVLFYSYYCYSLPNSILLTVVLFT